MTDAEALQMIAAKIESDWIPTETPVIFPGKRDERPTDAAHVIVRFRRDVPSRSVTHGRPGERQVTRAALLIAEVYEPINELDGSIPALDRAGRFRALFEGLDVPNTPGAECLNFDDATTTDVGVDGNFYQVNVTCPHTYPATF